MKLEGPVLDVGCGDGLFAGSVFEEPLDAGIDLDPKEVDRARKSGAYKMAMVADVTKMPFDTHSFNSVISNCVLEHVPDIDRALSEIRRVLKPGGRLYITVPSECYNVSSFLQTSLRSVGLPGVARAYTDLLNRVFKHFHVDSSGTWEARMKQAGLQLERAEYLISTPAYGQFERWMWFSFPSKINRALFGRWVILPRWPATVIAPLWFGKNLERRETTGACYFLAAREISGAADTTGTAAASSTSTPRTGFALQGH